MSRSFTRWVLSLLLLSICAIPLFGATLNETIEKITAVHQRGQLDSALTLCNQALKTWPDSIRLHDLRLNIATVERPRLRKLIWEYKQDLAKHPTSTRAKLLYGLSAYTEEGDSARLAIVSAVQQDTLNPWAAYIMAEQNYYHSRLGDALGWGRRAVSLDTTFARAYAIQAEVYLSWDSLSWADKAARIALKHDPENLDPLLLSWEARLREERRPEALAPGINDCVDSLLNNAKPSFMLYQTAWKLLRYAHREDRLPALIAHAKTKLGPGLATDWLEMSAVYSSPDTARLAERLDTFTTTHSKSAYLPGSVRRMYQIAIQKKDYPRAIELGRRLMALSPKDFYLALSLAMDGADWDSHFEFGLEMAEKAESMLEKISNEEFFRYTLLDEDYSLARNLELTKAQVKLAKGWLYADMGKPEMALKSLRPGYAVVKDLPKEKLDSWNNIMGQTFFQMGMWDSVYTYHLPNMEIGQTFGGKVLAQFSKAYTELHGPTANVQEAVDNARKLDFAYRKTELQASMIDQPVDSLLCYKLDGMIYNSRSDTGKVAIYYAFTTFDPGDMKFIRKIMNLYKNFEELHKGEVKFYLLCLDDIDNIVQPWGLKAKLPIEILKNRGWQNPFGLETTPGLVILDQKGKMRFRHGPGDLMESNSDMRFTYEIEMVRLLSK